MARNTSKRNSNEISAREIAPAETKWNNPAIQAMIEEAQAALRNEKLGDLAKFENAFKDAERLNRAKTEFEFSTEQLKDLAVALGRSRSVAADLLKLEGYRDAGLEWFKAHELVGRRKKRLNLTWQAFARHEGLIVRKSDQNRASSSIRIAQLTNERDNYKHQLDEALAEIERLKSSNEGA